jgi:hypothetical protein
MFAVWENKFRKHWPHHYRDVVDKVNSPLGLVVVNDTENNNYPCDRPIVRLERSFKLPTTYKIVVQDPLTSKVLEEKKYLENELEKAVINFVEIIGGWEDQVH